MSVKSNSIGEWRNPTSARIFQLLKCQGNKTSHKMFIFPAVDSLSNTLSPNKKSSGNFLYFVQFSRHLFSNTKTTGFSRATSLGGKEVRGWKFDILQNVDGRHPKQQQ